MNVRNRAEKWPDSLIRILIEALFSQLVQQGMVSPFGLERVKLVTNIFKAKIRPSSLLSNWSFDNGSTTTGPFWGGNHILESVITLFSLKLYRKWLLHPVTLEILIFLKIFHSGDPFQDENETMEKVTISSRKSREPGHLPDKKPTFPGMNQVQ